METDEVRDLFVIPIRDNNGSYEIFFSKEDTGRKDIWVDLRDVKTWSENMDGGRLYKYYLAFLSLSTNL